MKTLIIATHNAHKVSELRPLLSRHVKLVSLSDLQFDKDIPETAMTLEGNALLKASFVHNTFNLDCFADDTGLEIDALGGKPGVFSARYAGQENNFEANVSKVLNELKDVENRSARFRTVICLIFNSKIHYFEGSIEGAITKERRGNQGFGYDPVFIPDGYNLTFAEMSLEQKNTISHRAIATTKLLEFLNKTY